MAAKVQFKYWLKLQIKKIKGRWREYKKFRINKLFPECFPSIDNLRPLWISFQWQKEIETKYAEVDKLYKAYQADAVLLTDDMKKKRENEIINKEKEVKDLQKQRFGVDGELFKKRQELVKPIQDKVYNAIKAVAEKSGLGFVMDKSGQVSLLYANSKYDKSDDVLVYLGYKK